MALIVFCLYGDKPELVIQAGMMVGTCKRLGYEVLQLSDGIAPEVSGVDRVLRKVMDCPQVLFRYRWLQEVEPPYISLDVDLLVLHDISGLVDMDYDATMTRRENNDGMIYNGGVFSVQKRGFIEDCVEQIERMPAEFQNWTGGQRAMVDAAQRWKVKEADCLEWNYSPTSLHEPLRGKKVLHFKGKRRAMMEPAHAMFCA